MDKQPSTPPRPDPQDEKKRAELLQRRIRTIIGYVVVALVAMWLFQELVPSAMRATELPYSELKRKIAAGQVVEVVIGHDRIQGTLKNPQAGQAGQGGKAGDKAPETTSFTTVYVPESDPKLTEELDKAGVKYGFEQPSSPIGAFVLSWLLPLALVYGFYTLFF